MNLSRFTALAEAYGADIGRWPAAEQDAAHAFAADNPAARPLLADADILDHALYASPTLTASRGLYDRIVAEAPRLVARSRAMRWLSALGLGAALATACASGVAVGAVFAPAGILQLQHSDDLQEASSLMDASSDSGAQTGGGQTG